MRTFTKQLVLVIFLLLITLLNPNGISAQEMEIDTLEELPLQPMAFDATGIYDLKALDNSLNGEGVKYAVICRSFTYIDDIPQNDYRPEISHNCFSSSNFSFFQDDTLPYGVSPHATSLCSILFGEDEYAYHPSIGRFYYQGVVPKAQANVYEFWHFVKNNISSRIPPDADIITASFGDQFDQWWTRGMESLAERYGIVVVAGIGNGILSNDPVLYPAAGSNAIGVGVIDSLNTDDLRIKLETFALADPDHSSAGPTVDERCKPDIVAPGDCLAADIMEPNKYEPTGNWSSFSTPIVSGAIGLLIQKAKQESDLSLAVSPYGGNSVIKAILLNSATKLPYWHKGKLTLDDDHTTPLDYIQGTGMLNALGAYNTLIAGRKKPGEVANTGWDLNQLDNKIITSNIYQMKIDEPADKYITATLCWNRHFDKVYPFNALIEKNCDLRIELWAVDSNDSDNKYLLDYSDSKIDNVEHIYVKADPNITNYEIVLLINENTQNIDNTQRYGFAWNVSTKENLDSEFWYDLNADGEINMDDLTVLLENQASSLKSSEEYLIGDINSDGEIRSDDILDFLDIFENNEFDKSQITDSITNDEGSNLVSAAN